MKKQNPTVTIGIPAYNEEKNIGNLLASIMRQQQISYCLEKVIVVCDGCTDKTADVVKSFARKYRIIRFVERKMRTGKADALNLIYKTNKSDFLLTVDGDLFFAGNSEIEKMMCVIKKDPTINVVGPRHIPVMANSLMGKFAFVSYMSFSDAFLKLYNGNNFYAMMAVAFMRKNFVQTLRLPKGTISDQCYVYAKATRNNPNGFRLVRDAHVLFRTVSTFRDWRVLGVRSVIGDKENVAKYFGAEILSEFYMPRRLFIRSLFKWLLKSPFYMLGSIFMNMYIRKFPYKKVTPKNGMWTLATSSKEAIVVGSQYEK